MSWKEVATCFQVRWDHVYNSVIHSVSWGLSHRNLDGMESIGVDEVQRKHGYKYQTLVYQIDEGCKRLLWIGPPHLGPPLHQVDNKSHVFYVAGRRFGRCPPEQVSTFWALKHRDHPVSLDESAEVCFTACS